MKAVKPVVPDGPALDWKARNTRRADLLATWRQRQLPKILEARGPIIAAACDWRAGQIADRQAWFKDARDFYLSADTIQDYEDRAISQERARHFGPLPKDEGTWQHQIGQCRAAILAGQRIDVEEEAA